MILAENIFSDETLVMMFMRTMARFMYYQRPFMHYFFVAVHNDILFKNLSAIIMFSGSD
jgi:hypothetical protein